MFQFSNAIDSLDVQWSDRLLLPCSFPHIFHIVFNVHYYFPHILSFFILAIIEEFLIFLYLHQYPHVYIALNSLFGLVIFSYQMVLCVFYCWGVLWSNYRYSILCQKWLLPFLEEHDWIRCCNFVSISGGLVKYCMKIQFLCPFCG